MLFVTGADELLEETAEGFQLSPLLMTLVSSSQADLLSVGNSPLCRKAGNYKLFYVHKSC